MSSSSISSTISCQFYAWSISLVIILLTANLHSVAATFSSSSSSTFIPTAFSIRQTSSSLIFVEKSKRSNSDSRLLARKQKGGVSSSLADWAASTSTPNTSSNSDSDNDNDSTTITTSKAPATSSTEESSAAFFVPFQTEEKVSKKGLKSRSTKKKTTTTNNNTNKRETKNNRRQRQKERMARDARNSAVTKAIVEQIRDTIDTKSNIDMSSLLSLFRQLIQTQQSQSNDDFGEDDATLSSLKTLLKKPSSSSTTNNSNYSLAWVGGDDAICHIGTGLHKVPLARLDEMFLTLGGIPPPATSLSDINNNIIGKKSKKRKDIRAGWTIYEVIRILGPFPNVRNTLQGAISIPSLPTSSSSPYSSSSSVPTVNIRYESMIDGTGKELLAGKEENARDIPLSILYADTDAILCIKPSSSSTTTNDDSPNNIIQDCMGTNGENVLLFLREDDMDAKMELMRVA
mmetsp:Transcript_14127/g.20172  ORF Transcript_14127/g.20172 Transcript_14127/m.20172 type:complete len:459 (+) Transcript_14127:84-1460(+)